MPKTNKERKNVVEDDDTPELETIDTSVVSDEETEDLKVNNEGKKVIIVLEDARLETVKTKKGFCLLNSDDNKSLHRKLKTDPSEYRPDICHQMLLTILDSPLNKSGHLKVYIHTKNNILIDVNSKLRIPRTYKRFEGLMIQLLHKYKIRSAEGDETLLKVIKNPISRYLPSNSLKFCTSVTGTLLPASEFVSSLPDDKPLVFVFGAIAHGHINVDYTDELISLSQYCLSGSVAVGRLLSAIEEKWKIL